MTFDTWLKGLPHRKERRAAREMYIKWRMKGADRVGAMRVAVMTTMQSMGFDDDMIAGVVENLETES